MVRHAKEPLWRTVSRYHQLTDAEIVECIQLVSKVDRAVRLESAAQFMVIEIKEGSRYFVPSELLILKQELSQASLTFKHYQLDEDWYLYLFLDDWIQTDVASSLLKEWLTQHGFSLDEQGLSVLSTGDVLPLPLQKRFVWLNDNSQAVVCRDQISLESAVALFLADLDRSAISVDSLVDELTKPYIRSFAPPSSITDRSISIMPLLPLLPPQTVASIEQIYRM